MSDKLFSQSTDAPVAPRAESPLPTRFVFGGAAGKVLQDYFRQDAQSARLSSKFKLYYRLRPFIPILLRQLMQRGRNQGIDAPANWYLPADFVRDFHAAVLSEPETAVIHPWPDGFRMSVVLTHDVETKTGCELVDRLAALEEEYGMRSAWNFVPYKYKVDGGLLSDLKARGHEIGVHGYNHDGRLFESRRTFNVRLDGINQALANYGATGFRAPMMHRNLDWLQDLDVDYDASCFDIDPFQAMPGGVGGAWPFFAGKFVELPYTLPQDHTLLVSLGETTPRIWFEKLAYLRGLAGMALLITHPDYMDTPARLDVYREFLEHVARQSDCWHALPSEVADWWRIRDNLEIVERRQSPELVGPMANRARLCSLSDFLPTH